MCFVWHEYLILLWSLYEPRIPSEEALCYRASNYVHKWRISIFILNYHMYMYTLQYVKFVLQCSICACGHLCFCFWFYIIVPLLWGDQLLVLFLWAWYTGPDHEMCGSLHLLLAVQCSQCTISHLLVSEPDPHTWRRVWFRYQWVTGCAQY